MYCETVFNVHVPDCIKCWKRKPYIQLHDIDLKSDEDVILESNSMLLLKKIDPCRRYFFKYHVKENCSLKEFVEQLGLEFRRGCAYYEFKEYTENISKDKEVVIVCEVL